MADEARTLNAAVSRDGNPYGHQIIVTGIGPENAAAGAERMLAGRVDALVSWGTAGALCAELTPGKLLVYTNVVESSGTHRQCDPTWQRDIIHALRTTDVRTGSGYTSDHAITDPAEKAAIHSATKCVAVDMESAAIGSAAAAAGVRFVAVRAIVDPAAFTIPRIALDAVARDGTTRPWSVISSLAHSPGDLPALLRLARWHRAALATLQHAAMLLRPAFAATGSRSERAKIA
jgi:adenosylhomocysteine nucleosidase